MALAARCPHCRALFRVIADQLKLRGGLVRCGECRKVFDAIGSLIYVDDHALLRVPDDAPLGGAAHPGPAAPVQPTRAATAPAPVVRPREPVAQAEQAAPARVVERGRRKRAVAEEGAELSVPTLFGGNEQLVAMPGPLESEPGAARRRETYVGLLGHEDGSPPETDAEGLETATPSFLSTQGQRRQRRQRRILAAACVPLALAAAGQFALALREDALEAWPSMRPLLVGACEVYGCTVDWPAHADLLTIVGSDLAAVPGTDVIELNAAIRNRAPFTMALPALEVTLTDTQNRTIARKVFLPADYLASTGEPSSRIEEGLAPESDLSVRLVFEAQGLNAAGFVLYPFYL
jgi:predicted Zn finger-like uncharacterized protein